MLVESGNRLYRCRAKVLYKFFGSDLAVVFDEKYIQDISINLGWDPNISNMNSESVDTGVMSFTGSMNTCSVTITDPFFTGITWPSLMDVAGAAIGSQSYQSKGILKPKCEPGQDPTVGGGCWDYQLLDTANWIPTNNSNEQLSNLSSTYKQPAMIMISLWYEAYNGYTFGTDFLYRVSGSSATHGSDFPNVTISGQGNFGITFQDRLVNVSIDNELEVEKALAELAARNQFNMEFCVADYDDPQKLERKVIKSNLTIKQLLDDIVKNKLKGNYASFPTKDMYNTLHVCTRADAWNGCSVFYLNRPLYEQFKISAIVDSTMVGRNIEYGESVEGDSRADGGSGYLPSLLDKDSAWEIIRPKDKKYLDISTMSYDGKELKVGFKDAESAKPINGSWGGFKEKRDKYFTTYNDKLLILEGTDKVLQKKEYNKVNPGWIGEFAGGKASVLLPGRVTELNEIAEGGGHSVAVKTDYLIYLRGMTSKKVSKLPLYADLRLFKADSDVKIGYKVPLGGIVGQSLPEKQQNLAYYISLQNTKVFLDPSLALKIAFPASYDPGVPNVPDTLQEPSVKSGSGTPGGGSAPGTNDCYKVSHITPANRSSGANKQAIGANNIILTFDDGPDSTWTPKILDVLKKHGAKATFYLIGNRIPGREAIVRRIVAEGHDIASHSQTHPNFTRTLSNNTAARIAQIKDSIAAIARATPKKPSSFRFPYGAGSENPKFLGEVAAQGLSSVYWHLDPKDFKAGWSAGDMIRTIESQGISGGKILLFHDGLDLRAGSDPNVTTSKAETVKAVDQFLTKYKGKFNFTRTMGDVLRTTCGGTGDGDEVSAGGDATAATPVAEGTRPMLKFKWPASGVFTSAYGNRRNPVTGKMAMHRGIDIAAPIGTPIVAAAPGRVVQIHNQCATTSSGGCGAPRLGGYGNSITIDHGNGYRTFYAHLQKDSIKVSMNQVVAQGQQIAGMGSSGNSTGPHLHYEVTFSGQVVNPSLRGAGGSITAGSDTSHRQPSDGVTVNVNADGVTVSPGGQSNANQGQTAPGGGTGFSIETEFKGVPRALRILPKFTILSLVGDYQQWLSDGMSEGTDPGIWVPDYFRNWLIRSVQFNWQSDLRVKINASSVFGISNENAVPKWESYAADLVEQGKYSGYVDYIRAYGDLCWNDGGQPSCHTRCAVTEDFMRAGMTSGTVGAQGGLSSANVSDIGACKLEGGGLKLSDADRKLLFQIVGAEGTAKDGKIGYALVARAIFNRKLFIEKYGANYGSNGKSDLRSIIYARDGVEFSPVQDKRINNDFSAQADLINAAIELAFDHEALLKLGVRKEILASPNFVNVPSYRAGNARWWGEPGYLYGGHWFGRDSGARSRSPDRTIEEFAARYGKCTKTGNTTAPTGAPVGSGLE